MVIKGKTLEEAARSLLAERGVEVADIAELVMFLQKQYIDKLTIEECMESVNAVLTKREVHNAILTGIQLDLLAEKGEMIEPLQAIVRKDEGLYGVDEIMAFSIVNLYGSIGFTNYGYIDKIKPGILEKLNDHESASCNTFLDDLVGAIAAAAASRLAHDRPSLSDAMK